MSRLQNLKTESDVLILFSRKHLRALRPTGSLARVIGSEPLEYFELEKAHLQHKISLRNYNGPDDEWKYADEAENISQCISAQHSFKRICEGFGHEYKPILKGASSGRSGDLLLLDGDRQIKPQSTIPKDSGLGEDVSCEDGKEDDDESSVVITYGTTERLWFRLPQSLPRIMDMYALVGRSDHKFMICMA
ncbi:hypothetical protein N7540_010419 [Penicillium herquei]|nr:hypothetical protein N7540_010419 [Penicillium herquei]